MGPIIIEIAQRNIEKELILDPIIKEIAQRKSEKGLILGQIIEEFAQADRRSPQADLRSPQGGGRLMSDFWSEEKHSPRVI